MTSIGFKKKRKFNPKLRPTFKVLPESKNTGEFRFLGYSGTISKTDLYVRSENINGALDRDIVEYVVLENTGLVEEGKNKFEAKVVSVIKRHKIHFMGEIIHKEPNKTFVLLDSPKLRKVLSAPPTEYPIGDKVRVKLTGFEIENLQGQIEKSLGSKEQINIEIASILEDYGVSLEFPQEVIEESNRITLGIEEHRKEKVRKDYTSIPLITIDPDDSKDFDDAIAVLKNDEGFHLYVAIADVWTYIRESKAINEEASKRGTSIYFLNSVIPMLPEKLCNDFCSLVPHKERCAIVFDVKISKDGEIHWDEMNINPGIIKSHRRFTYEEVNDFFNGKTDLKDEEKSVVESIRNGLELYRSLERQRMEKGYVSAEFPEIKINLNDRGEITSTYPYRRGHAQIMIENFMILTNEGIGRYCEKHNIPTVFRVHEDPDASKMIGFIQEAKKLNFKADPITSKVTQKMIGKWFENNRDNKHIEIIGLMLIRSLQKARYSINNIGHFGLNLKNYLHFTSPIRRYPDTLVHKMLWEYVFEKKESIPQDEQYPIYKELDKHCTHCTEQEIMATEVSREIENAKIIKYTNTQLNKVFKARMISPSKTGGFVRLEDIYIEGFVKSRTPINLGQYLLVSPIYNSKEFKIVKIL